MTFAFFTNLECLNANAKQKKKMKQLNFFPTKTKAQKRRSDSRNKDLN